MATGALDDATRAYHEAWWGSWTKADLFGQGHIWGLRREVPEWRPYAHVSGFWHKSESGSLDFPLPHEGEALRRMAIEPREKRHPVRLPAGGGAKDSTAEWELPSSEARTVASAMRTRMVPWIGEQAARSPQGVEMYATVVVALEGRHNFAFVLRIPEGPLHRLQMEAAVDALARVTHAIGRRGKLRRALAGKAQGRFFARPRPRDGPEGVSQAYRSFVAEVGGPVYAFREDFLSDAGRREAWLASWKPRSLSEVAYHERLEVWEWDDYSHIYMRDDTSGTSASMAHKGAGLRAMVTQRGESGIPPGLPTSLPQKPTEIVLERRATKAAIKIAMDRVGELLHFAGKLPPPDLTERYAVVSVELWERHGFAFVLRIPAAPPDPARVRRALAEMVRVTRLVYGATASSERPAGRAAGKVLFAVHSWATSPWKKWYASGKLTPGTDFGGRVENAYSRFIKSFRGPIYAFREGYLHNAKTFGAWAAAFRSDELARARADPLPAGAAAAHPWVCAACGAGACFAEKSCFGGPAAPAGTGALVLRASGVLAPPPARADPSPPDPQEGVPTTTARSNPRRVEEGKAGDNPAVPLGPHGRGRAAPGSARWWPPATGQFRSWTNPARVQTPSALRPGGLTFDQAVAGVHVLFSNGETGTIYWVDKPNRQVKVRWDQGRGTSIRAPDEAIAIDKLEFDTTVLFAPESEARIKAFQTDAAALDASEVHPPTAVYWRGDNPAKVKVVEVDGTTQLVVVEVERYRARVGAWHFTVNPPGTS